MIDLTPQELTIMRSAGRRLQPAWLVWTPAILGGVGGLLIAGASLFGEPEPDIRGIAYGLTTFGSLLSISSLRATNQVHSSLIAKLRQRIDQGEKVGR
jgi:hypothetical protein